MSDPPDPAEVDYDLLLPSENRTLFENLRVKRPEPKSVKVSTGHTLSGGVFYVTLTTRERLPPHVEENIAVLSDGGDITIYDGPTKKSVEMNNLTSLPFGARWYEAPHETFVPDSSALRCRECDYKFNPDSIGSAAMHFREKHSSKVGEFDRITPEATNENERWDPIISDDGFPEQEVVEVDLGKCRYCGETVKESHSERIESGEDVYCNVSCLNAEAIQ